MGNWRRLLERHSPGVVAIDGSADGPCLRNSECPNLQERTNFRRQHSTAVSEFYAGCRHSLMANAMLPHVQADGIVTLEVPQEGVPCVGNDDKVHRVARTRRCECQCVRSAQFLASSRRDGLSVRQANKRPFNGSQAILTRRRDLNSPSAAFTRSWGELALPRREFRHLIEPTSTLSLAKVNSRL